MIAAFRWWYLILVGVALLLLASFYLDAGTQTWMNQHQNPSLRSFMQAVSRYGDWPEHLLVGIVLTAIASWSGRKKWVRIFIAMILACALAGAAARMVKIATGRARPSVQADAGWNGPRISPRYNSFPSGHTAASTAFFATLAFASWRIGLGLLVFPLGIAFSRMYVGAHYLSDVFFAAVLGVLAAYLVTRWRYERPESS